MLRRICLGGRYTQWGLITSFTRSSCMHTEQPTQTWPRYWSSGDSDISSPTTFPRLSSSKYAYFLIFHIHLFCFFNSANICWHPIETPIFVGKVLVCWKSTVHTVFSWKSGTLDALCEVWMIWKVPYIRYILWKVLYVRYWVCGV